jgi:hypothetical protein
MEESVPAALPRYHRQRHNHLNRGFDDGWQIVDDALNQCKDNCRAPSVMAGRASSSLPAKS